jgi:hypothetical protein
MEERVADPKRTRTVREPIQVYLDGDEREVLDVLAGDLAVSRAEVLRRGLVALRREQSRSVYDALAPLVGAVQDPDAPADLARRFDEYQAADRAPWPRRRSS